VPTAIASFALTSDCYKEAVGSVVVLGGDTDALAHITAITTLGSNANNTFSYVSTQVGSTGSSFRPTASRGRRAARLSLVFASPSAAGGDAHPAALRETAPLPRSDTMARLPEALAEYLSGRFLVRGPGLESLAGLMQKTALRRFRASCLTATHLQHTLGGERAARP
jgi:hypothetical protein